MTFITHHLTSDTVNPLRSAELLMVCHGALGTSHSISRISSGGSTTNSTFPATGMN